MTANEKAKVLVDEFYLVCQEYTEEIQCSLQAKQCALIVVDEIFKAFNFKMSYKELIFWNEVKQEIEKL